MKIFTVFSTNGFLMFCIGTVLVSCYSYPSNTDYLDDYDITITSYDDSKDFSAYHTYAIPDSVPILDGTETSNGDISATLESSYPEFADDVRSEIQKYMGQYGYTEIDEAVTTPDVVLNVAVLNATDPDIPCWWYDVGGYWSWYPDWNWESDTPWADYVCLNKLYYSYQQGTLVLDMIDVSESRWQPDVCEREDGGCYLDISWSALIKGFLSTDKPEDVQMSVQGIQQAFEQSGYLNTGN